MAKARFVIELFNVLTRYGRALQFIKNQLIVLAEHSNAEDIEVAAQRTAEKNFLSQWISRLIDKFESYT